MRRSSLAVVLLRAALGASLAAGAALAQPAMGSYVTTNPQGQRVTLLLQRDGEAVTGALSGNGTSFLVQGQVEGETIVGLMRGNGGGVFFEARPDGAGLTLTLVEPDAAGQPNFARARQLSFQPDGGAASAPGVTKDAPASAAQRAAAGPAGRAGAGRAGGPGTGKTAQDQQIVQLLQSRAWCAMKFSSSGTYTGGSGSSTTTWRTTFTPDGVVTETTGGERVNTGAPGAVWGSSSNAQRGYYRIEDGALVLSADGQQWAPSPMQIYDNGSGYPIVKVNGREYNGCR